jgi:hypothetical protein
MSVAKSPNNQRVRTPLSDLYAAEKRTLASRNRRWPGVAPPNRAITAAIDWLPGCRRDGRVELRQDRGPLRAQIS